MQPEPILMYDTRLTVDDVCLRRLIEFFGLKCRSVEASACDAELDGAADHELCILASASTVHHWCRKLPDPAAGLDRLRRKASSLFVYGFMPETPPYIAFSLSDCKIVDVRRFTRTGLRYEVSTSRAEITREFSGLSFGGVLNDIDLGFVCSANSRNLAPLVTIEDTPFWLLVENNRCQAFLLACCAIANIEERVHGNIDVTKYFSRLLPVAMFLRSAFKNRCWHNKSRFANLIIDDPPLKSSYGYLRYRELVSMMDKARFSGTIAFIPWNYKRTDKQVTQLFRERPDRLSLCVHGCDHTAAEFATSDLAVLNSRVQLASARMDSLRRQDGVVYSKAMVFPQGRFSPEALTALKSNNYLAAVNSTALPDDSASAPFLTMADFLEPAVTRYCGVPLFGRRYPGALAQFAFDLFFGKPALVVEHHACLRDSGGNLGEFIAGLNGLERLQWSGLEEIMTKSYLEHEISSESTACRLYTNHHFVQNHAEREQLFIITKSETDGALIQTVLVNGRETDFVVSGNLLHFTIRIPAFSSREIQIAYRNVLPEKEPRRAFASRSRVWTRRMLSEFRDNVLCRSDLLLAGAHALQRKLPGRTE